MRTILVLLLCHAAAAAQDLVAPIVLTAPSGAPAVVFGQENLAYTTGTGTTTTQGFTVTDADLLIVCVTGTWAGPTGVTHNGDAMTQQTAKEYSGFGSWIYTIQNPDVGTHDVVVSWPWATDATLTVIGWKKTHDTTPVSGADVAEGNSTGPTINISSATGAVVVDCLCWNKDGASTVTVGAGQTQKSQQTVGDYCGGAASTESGATTVTMSWTIGTAREWALTAISVNPE